MKYINRQLHNWWNNVRTLLWTKWVHKKVEEKCERKKRELPTPEVAHVSGEYSSVKHLIKDIDVIFKNAKKLKPSKSEHQRIMRKYGLFLLDTSDNEKSISADTLESVSVVGLPTFICNTLNSQRSSDEELCHAFFVASKNEAPFGFKKSKEYVYYLVSYTFMVPFHGVIKPCEVAYQVRVNTQTNEVYALPDKISRQHALPPTKRGKRKGGRSVPTSHWGYIDMRSEKMQKEEDDFSNENKKQHLEMLFRLNYNLMVRRESGINVIVKKDKQRITFGVPHHQWKRFFKDRVDAVARDGKKKRIFHAVSAHQRHMKDGTTRNVRTHYKGSRHFMWDGCDVRIVLPGKHSLSQAAWNVPFVDAETVPQSEKTISPFGNEAATVNALFDGTKTIHQLKAEYEDKHAHES